MPDLLARDQNLAQLIQLLTSHGLDITKSIQIHNELPMK